MRIQLLAILAAGTSSAALAGPTGWTISEAAGPVMVARSGISTVATRGNTVNAGDVVTTGPRGRAVLVRGTEFMMVAPASRLRLPAEEQATGVTRVVEEFGNVVFMIKKKMTPHFEVQTPYLAAVVKGTTFSVGVSPQGTSIQVLEGAVDVATLDGGAHDLITPGAVAKVSASNRFRMTVEDNGRTRVIDSPAANGSTIAPDAPQAELASEPSIEVVSAAPPLAAITTAIYSPTTSLATTTAGLISGTVGGDLANATRAAVFATEASSSASRIIVVATTILTANSMSAEASEAARRKEVELAAAGQAKVEIERVAQVSTAAASNAADEAAKARTGELQSAAAKAATAATADQAIKIAAVAASDAVNAEADRLAKAIAMGQAEAEASAAARAAEVAAAAAADAPTEATTRAAEKAAKDAATAADKAGKAAEDARRASDDKVVKELEKVARDKDAEKAAKEAEKAAKDAEKASQDKVVKEAEKAAREVEQAAAKAAEDIAKQQEKTAKDAQKAAEDAAKTAQKVADQAAKDAGNKIVDAAKQLVNLVVKK